MGQKSILVNEEGSTVCSILDSEIKNGNITLALTIAKTFSNTNNFCKKCNKKKQNLYT